MNQRCKIIWNQITERILNQVSKEHKVILVIINELIQKIDNFFKYLYLENIFNHLNYNYDLL